MKKQMPTSSVRNQMFTREDWESKLRCAAQALCSEVPCLLGRATRTEMSVVHRFAMHLAACVEGDGVYVDVELTRDGDEVKPSAVGEYSRIDVCVHTRSPNGGNLLALEVKWADAGADALAAAAKQAQSHAKSSLRYKFSAVLTIPRRNGFFLLKWATTDDENSHNAPTNLYRFPENLSS